MSEYAIVVVYFHMSDGSRGKEYPIYKDHVKDNEMEVPGQPANPNFGHYGFFGLIFEG